MEQIRRASRHLLGILTDVLDFSKIDGGHLQLEHKPFSLSSIFVCFVDMLKNKELKK